MRLIVIGYTKAQGVPIAMTRLKQNLNNKIEGVKKRKKIIGLTSNNDLKCCNMGDSTIPLMMNVRGLLKILRVKIRGNTRGGDVSGTGVIHKQLLET